jgi:hypothetical protein
VTIKNITIERSELEVGDKILAMDTFADRFTVERDEPSRTFAPGTVIKDCHGPGLFFRTDGGKWINLPGGDSQTSDDWFSKAIDRGGYHIAYDPKGA